MRSPSHRQRALLLCGLGSGVIAGCMFVAPLDDLPNASGGASHGGASHGGSSGGGASPGAGSPTDGGDATVPGHGGQDSSGKQCTTNAECVSHNADEPARCRPSDHTCVTLRSDQCPVVIGTAAADPNAIVFGAFAPINPNAPDQDPIVLAHRLALQELSGDNVGGLPDGPEGLRRPLVMVVCSNADASVEPALSHLIDDVETQAVIANLKPADLRRGFEAHQAKDVFFLSPIAVTQPLVIQPDHDLIWNILGQPGDLATTYTALLLRYETFVRGVRGLAATDPIKVALVTTTDAFNAELSDAVEPELKFNGQGPTANRKAGNYSAFTLQLDDPQLGSVATNIVEARPDIIISTANELLTMPSGLLQQIEMEWGDNTLKGTAEQRKNRPFYILSPYNAGDLATTGALIAAFIEANETEANRRFIGISIAGAEDTTLQRAYEGRLRKLFKTPDVDTANYYDAVYYLAYAMYGAGEAQPTGPGIARGMQRLLSGQSFNIGPSAVSQVFNALSAPGASVNVQSTLGPPSFDPKTGVRPVTGGVFCFDKAGKPVNDVLRYDAAKKDVVGQSFPCFSGIYP